MDVSMLIEDPRLEYVAHSRAMHAFYYVGEYRGLDIPAHPDDQAPGTQAPVSPQIKAAPIAAEVPKTSADSVNLQNLVNKFSKSR
jgi:hypothetical protein